MKSISFYLRALCIERLGMGRVGKVFKIISPLHRSRGWLHRFIFLWWNIKHRNKFLTLQERRWGAQHWQKKSNHDNNNQHIFENWTDHRDSRLKEGWSRRGRSPNSSKLLRQPHLSTKKFVLKFRSLWTTLDWITSRSRNGSKHLETSPGPVPTSRWSSLTSISPSKQSK